MYRTPFNLPLRDFIEAQGIPSGDEIHVIRPTCDDDGVQIKADVVYSGKAGSVPEEIGETAIDAINSDFNRNQSGYWHIETPPVYQSDLDAVTQSDAA